MELWVRSQDKTTLMKVDRLDIDYSSGLYSIKSDGFGTLLANYKSEERAMQVLDEIQQHIEKQGENYLLSDENGIITGQKYYGYIYQMPID
ncbi:MAG: hypothetical protein MR691_14980 [Clostridium sp.]|nr:hypothetical protein [Clostridium sp.]